MVIKSSGKPDYLPIRYSRKGRYFFIGVPNGEVYFPSNSFQVNASCWHSSRVLVHSLHSLWLLTNFATRPGQVTLSESSCTTSRLQHRIRPINATAPSRSVCPIFCTVCTVSVTVLAQNVRHIHPTSRKQSLWLVRTLYSFHVHIDSLHGPVDTVNIPKAERPRYRSSIPTKQTGSLAHTALYPIGTNITLIAENVVREWSWQLLNSI